MLCIIFGKIRVPLELVANATRQDSEIKKEFRKLTLKHTNQKNTNQIEKRTTCLVKIQRHSGGKGFLNTVYIVEQYGIFLTTTAMRPKPAVYNNKKKIIGG